MRKKLYVEEWTIASTQAGYLKRDFTVEDVVNAYLDRIEQLDQSGPRLNSIITVVERDVAISQARRQDSYLAEQGKLIGPLHGVTVLVKDQAETFDLITTFGNKRFSGYLPKRDATAIQKLKAAGAIILGKTTMPDFATNWYSTSSISGLTHNPYNLAHDVGGSSSGTAAAVAANLALVGIGEDTGGSIRLPSSYCNLVGLRVTPGLVSRDGMFALVEQQDTAGPMTRTVEDTAKVLDAIVGHDPRDPYTSAYVLGGSVNNYSERLAASAPGNIRLGVLRQAFAQTSTPEFRQVAEITDAALEQLRRQGVELIDIELDNLDNFLKFTSLYYSRSRQDMNHFLASRPETGLSNIETVVADGDIHPELNLLKNIATGPSTLHEDEVYLQRILLQGEYQRYVVSRMTEQGIEGIVFPDVQVPAPSHASIFDNDGECLDFPTNTLLASQLLFPAITVPAGFAEHNLPVGLEIMTTPFNEARLLTIAQAVEKILHARRRPTL